MHRPCISDSRKASGWLDTPFYTVGMATEKSLKACPPCKYSPVLILGGNETGTGEALAHYILKHHNIYDTSLPLLYLTGNKNRDTVPVTLAGGGLRVTPTQVYETGKRDGLEEDSQRTISTILSGAPISWNENAMFDNAVQPLNSLSGWSYFLHPHPT
jgi:uroporphyrinogen-III synthase